MSAIAFSRVIGPTPIDVFIFEGHESELDITRNPVEASADITDHAYSLPRRLVLEIADGNAAATWQALRRLQESRVPFTIVTGLDVYRNMLIRRLGGERDEVYSQVLRGKVELQEVILVDTATATGSDGARKSERGGDAKPGGAKSRRAAQPSSRASSGASTQDRAASTVKRGDSSSAPVSTIAGAEGERGRSILKSVFG